MSILSSISGHDDLVRLSDKDREQLCSEIRSFLIEKVSKTGGHLASNLGVVELTVAIETVYNTAIDRLVFDVGHQSYVHKLLTGRQAGFDSLRQIGGMAGFPKPSESDCDSFVAGHASSSVSIALGMARARTLQKQDHDVIAVIGDGAATGGMVYEGLNDAAESREPLVVVLNDNEMSIDRNVGGMARHLGKVRTRSGYLVAKRRYRSFLQKIPGGKWIYRVTRRIKDWFRRMLLPTTIFENMGFTYLGPVDGHNLPGLLKLLRSAKEMKRPVLIHVMTQKGKGYGPAEERPDTFHGVGAFDPETGKLVGKGGETFSSCFGKTLCQLAEENDRVCAITAAMPGGTGLLPFKERFPRRLFDVGIAEEHAVSMAGGLAKQGMIPVTCLYSTFLQRSYDMLLQDIGILGLHAVFAVDRAGLVGDDGETHHGVFDVGFLRHVPGMQLLAPASMAELQDMTRWAVLNCKGPVALRYPRGGDRNYHESAWPNRLWIHQAGCDVAIVTYGTLVENALEAAQLLQDSGVSTLVIRLLSIAPVPVEELKAKLSGVHHVFVMEETSGGTGIWQELAVKLNESDHAVHGLDLGDRFIPHGKIQELYRFCGLDGESVKNKVLEVVRDEN